MGLVWSSVAQCGPVQLIVTLLAYQIHIGVLDVTKHCTVRTAPKKYMLGF